MGAGGKRRAAKRRRVPGILCLEGDWWNDFNGSSTVKPLLKLLSQAGDHAVPFIYRDVATLDEFKHYCRRWSQSGLDNYPILYLAFHGTENCLAIGDQRRRDSVVDLDDLAEILGTDLGGRLVHFGSCETLRTDHRNIQRFLRKTGAIAVTGFRRTVDWLYSAVFDVLLFDAFVRRSLTRAGARSVKREMAEDHGSMCKKLDFRFVIRA